MQNFDGLELSAATTLPMPVITGVPRRLPVDPFTCYVMDGFLRGLAELENSPRVSVENFAEKLRKARPADLRTRLREPGYEIPEEMWMLIRGLSEQDQAKVSYIITWHAHMCEALHSVLVETAENEDPLETLAGQENLAFPLAIAGVARFWEVWDRVKPFLPRFGLDVWVAYDFQGNKEYPAVPKYAAEQYDLMVRLFNLGSHLGLEKFLRNPSAAIAKVPSLLRWPKELSIFRSDDAILDAIARYSAVNSVTYR